MTKTYYFFFLVVFAKIISRVHHTFSAATCSCTVFLKSSHKYGCSIFRLDSRDVIIFAVVFSVPVSVATVLNRCFAEGLCAQCLTRSSIRSIHAFIFRKQELDNWMLTFSAKRYPSLKIHYFAVSSESQLPEDLVRVITKLRPLVKCNLEAGKAWPLPLPCDIEALKLRQCS